jgi:hypothetical protein
MGKKVVLSKKFVWKLSVRVVQKTKKYFLNDQQQKKTNQTENGSLSQNISEDMGKKLF